MENRRGYRTTEFWLSTLAMVVGTIMASGAIPSSHWSVQVMGLVLDALAALGYTASRAKTKQAETLRDAGSDN